MQRILDLGCGTGDSWSNLGSDVENSSLIGLDPQLDRVAAATRKNEHRNWCYLCARGESIPLADRSVDGVLCRGALPYMVIPSALNEVYRILISGGWLLMTLHRPTFTLREFRRSFPNPKPMLGRSLVLLNGIYFHLTGRVISIRGRSESCQTKAGMLTALYRAGFRDVKFRHDAGRLVVEARRGGNAEAAGVAA